MGNFGKIEQKFEWLWMCKLPLFFIDRFEIQVYLDIRIWNILFWFRFFSKFAYVEKIVKGKGPKSNIKIGIFLVL